MVPIALIVYNRLIHTRQVIDALLKNVGVEASVLYIFSDAAANKEDYCSVAEVREYIKTVNGFKDVYVIERASNYGLAKNIIDAVTFMTNQYDSVIVLEDDIVTSKWFLKYMNEALIKYKYNEKVMAVSGHFPDGGDILPDTFFVPYFDCWGWGTWSRSWKCFEKNPERIIENADKNFIFKSTVCGVSDHWKQVLDNNKGRLDTWYVFFYMIILEKNGLVLNNSLKMCKNIGCDGSGIHCGISNEESMRKVGQQEVKIFPTDIFINYSAVSVLHNYYKRQSHILPYRVFRVFKEEGMTGLKKRILLRIQRHKEKLSKSNVI